MIRKLWFWIATLSLLCLASCSSSAPQPIQTPSEPDGPMTTSQPATTTPSTTPSPTETASSLTPSPSATPTTPAATTTRSVTKPHTRELTLYYVAVGDGGKAGEQIGCGDSLVATWSKYPVKGSQLADSMAVLLAGHDHTIGGSGLQNALADSRLTYVSGSYHGDVVTVHLKGTLKIGGTCDGPRVKRQLEQTAATAVGAGQAKVFVNDQPIEKLLGGR